MHEQEKERAREPKVLLISDDAGFSRGLTARWQQEPSVPSFTLLGGDLWPLQVEDFDVAIVGPLRPELLAPILDRLQATGQPLFCVCQHAAAAASLRPRGPRVGTLLRCENWMEGLILAASEAMRRGAAEAQARAAEQHCLQMERDAALGRYMLEMRHGLNNALTSLLGNADLLLMEPAKLPAPARGQMETIRNMTLRINEVMQRFSSLEKEMNVAAQQSERESGKWHANAAGH